MVLETELRNMKRPAHKWPVLRCLVTSGEARLSLCTRMGSSPEHLYKPIPKRLFSARYFNSSGSQGRCEGCGDDGFCALRDKNSPAYVRLGYTRTPRRILLSQVDVESPSWLS